MIRYSLRCDKDHRFDGWFASAEAFDALRAKGLVTCTLCGSSAVEKALMTPAVRTAPAPAAGPLAAPQTAVEEAFAAMRHAVEAQSDYVGVNFVSEVRAMHEGSQPERSIYGEAKLDEAKALLDEGIAVMPLPFLPKRSRN